MAKGMWQVLLLGLVAVAAVVADMMHDARKPILKRSQL